MTRVPLPLTHRETWPGSSLAEPFESNADIRITAWFQAKSKNDIDVASAFALAEQPPKVRQYLDQNALVMQTAADADAVRVVRAYCEKHGIRAEAEHWQSMTFCGPADRVIDAFGASVATHVDESGRRFRNRVDALHAPVEIARALRAVFGLHQWPRSQKLKHLSRHATPLLAREVASRYAFPEGDGAGETIAVVQFRGEFRANDFDRCMERQKLHVSHPYVRSVDRTTLEHEMATTKDLEAALDVQVIAALVPKARIVIYEAPDDERGFLDAVRTAIFDEEFAPSILSISYGWPERVWTPAALRILDELFACATLLGISVFCSSGDHGAEIDDEGKPHVIAPASSPFVHACGGTVIGADGSVETAWEDSGSGYSAHFDAPAWQANSNGRRGIPDVAAQVVPGYLVYLEGTELAIGGTSAVAPVFAALTARINQRAGIRAGLMTPLLYRAANAAGKAWDPRTGLGTPNGAAIERVVTAT